MKSNALKTAHGKRAAYVSNQRPLLWLLPLFVVLLAFFLVPTLDVIRLSFTNASLAKPSYDYTTKSYLKVIRDSAFPEIMSVTLIFVSISVVFQFLLGFVIAYCVDKGKIPPAGHRGGAHHLFGFLGHSRRSHRHHLEDHVRGERGGILNYLLSLLGFGQVAFLSDPNTAIFSVCLANIWRGTAQSMILLYSGLKTVPADVLEAADVDGASNWRKIVSVTIPSMKSVITVNILLNIINTFNTFDMIMPLTGGGPGHSTEVLVLGAYRTIFQQLDMGKGCAMAVILLCINVFFSLIYIRAGKEED